MNDQNSQLAIANSGSIQSFEQMEAASAKLSASGLMGPKTTPEMVFGLMLLCQCEGLNPVAAMKRYHIVEGRPSMRADAMQAEFLSKGGAIIFHVRTDEMVAATLFSDKSRLDEKARERALKRFEAMWSLDCEENPDNRSKLMMAISQHSMDGEETIIRTFADCQAKGITNGANGIKANWKTSPRQMLTARVITEGVRLVNPGLIAGIYSEDETADIARQEREAVKAMLDNPTPADREAIMGMIEEYTEQLKTATDGRKKTLLGLRADLLCKLGDIGATAPELPPEPEPTLAPGHTATVVESVPIPVAKEPEPAPAAKEEPAGDWQSVTNNIGFVGKPSGKLLNMTLGEIFKDDRSPKFIEPTMKFFTSQLGSKTALPPKDAALWRAIQQGHKAWEEAQKAAKPAEATTVPETTQEPAQPATEAPVTGWRAHEIKIKHPDWAGKLLGSFDIKEIHRIQTEYLDQVPDQNALTLPQKSLKANVALALAELLPPAANSIEETPFELLPREEPDHTTQLKDAIEGQNLNRNDFMAVCRKNDWISKDAKKIEDITLEEYNALSAEWSEVTKAVLANGV